LQPDPGNLFAPIKPETFAELVEDIKIRGIITPLLVKPAPGYPATKGGRILAGNNRYRAALEAGLDSVPVVYVEQELTPAEERRLVFADNVLRRQLTVEERDRILVEIYPEYFDEIGKPGPKRNNSVHGAPNSTAEEIAAQTGLSVDTIKRAKAKHQAAKERARAQGKDKPDHVDYQAAAQARNATRRGRDGLLPGTKQADQANKHTPPLKAAGPILTLGNILEAVESKHKSAAARAALADLRTRLQDAGLMHK